MTLNTYATLLFDLDGTLLDSAQDLHLCLNQLLTSRHQPLVELVEVQRIINQGVSGMIRLGFGDQLSKETHDQFSHQLLNRYREFLAKEPAHFFPGILTFLQTLSAHQIKWGIVTNKWERFTRPILKNVHLLDQASVIICGDKVRESKPSAEPLLMACEQLGENPEECCYVGDSLNDLLAAKNAGMPGFLACWGYWQQLRYSVEDWPYTQVFYHLEDLLHNRKFGNCFLSH